MTPMRTLSTFFLATLVALAAYAQAPPLLSYQAVVRDANNALVTQSAVGMRVSILQGSASGPAVFEESHTPSSNANGLVTVAIGGGSVISGSITGIDWANGPYFIQTETDPLGGTDYSIAGTTQLLSVPYALYAGQSGTPGPAGPAGPQGPPGTGLGNGTITNQVLYWDGTQWLTLDPGSTGQVLTLCADGLTWTFGGQCPGGISGLSCSAAVDIGTLTAGQAASGVSSSVPYTGGTGIAHTGQVVSSTGVTGLTATLDPGNFANGPGTLTYVITGTPNGSGTASFSLSIGGQTCILTPTIVAGGGSGITDATCGAIDVHNPNLTYGSVTDQDGNEYKTIVIGTQEWMAENLKAVRYSNGDPIPNVTDALQWIGLTTGAWVYGSNDSATYDCPYGRMYNWYAVADPRNVCPAGWHAPTDLDWQVLETELGMPASELNTFGWRGGVQNVGGKLKSAGSQYWITPNNFGTNESGWSALPGGFRSSTNGVFGLGPYSGLWWSSTENGSTNAWLRNLDGWAGSIARSSDSKAYGVPVRCIRD
jgi:uncharacterized protein (TIGR02145 family)